MPLYCHVSMCTVVPVHQYIMISSKIIIGSWRQSLSLTLRVWR